MCAADHVVIHEREGIGDAPIDVRAGREVKDVLHGANRMSDLAVDRRLKIMPDELKPLLELRRAVEDFRQAVEIARCIEPVETDDLPVGVLQQVLDEMMADKAGPARDQSARHASY